MPKDDEEFSDFEESKDILETFLETKSNVEFYKNNETQTGLIQQLKSLRLVKVHNTYKIFNRNDAFKSFIKNDFFISNENTLLQDKLKKAQDEVNEILKNIKKEYDKKPRNGKDSKESVAKKHTLCTHGKNCKYKNSTCKKMHDKKKFNEVINLWEKRNELNYQLNAIELFIPLRLHKFITQIYAKILREYQAYERDIIYMFLGFCRVNKSNSILRRAKYIAIYLNQPLNNFENSKITLNQFKKDKDKKRKKVKNLAKDVFNEFLNDLSFKNKHNTRDENTIYKLYKNSRNEIAHFNYFNQENYNKSLQDLVCTTHNWLKYNKKRKKSFREALEYIFDANDLDVEIVYDKNDGSIKDFTKFEAKTHQYSKYAQNFKTQKEKDNYLFNNLKLITKEEVKLFKLAFMSRNT